MNDVMPAPSPAWAVVVLLRGSAKAGAIGANS
jgi:hypothetical protein